MRKWWVEIDWMEWGRIMNTERKHKERLKMIHIPKENDGAVKENWWQDWKWDHIQREKKVTQEYFLFGKYSFLRETKDGCTSKKETKNRKRKVRSWGTYITWTSILLTYVTVICRYLYTTLASLLNSSFGFDSSSVNYGLVVPNSVTLFFSRTLQHEKMISIIR